ncbi:MAG: prepilin-type N-terminal cleavage/methylation domain-containing protein [Candidatus Dependentiae bacterium]|nr:prepilin-type N-terminal cleavage/methylation domain-containing protein [Candidatus Dependentiae bacterium]
MRNKHSGFTLIELVIAIAILAAIMALGMASMRQSTPRYERETLIARLNALLFVGWQNAIKSGKVHRISFDFPKRKISIAVATGTTDSQGEPICEPLSSKHGRTTLPIPDMLKVENFVIEGGDELKEHSDKQSRETWFYITPNGLTQEVTINFFDTKDRIAKKARPIGLVLNPFNAQFEAYDEFKK